MSEAIKVVGQMLRGYANGGAQASNSYIGALAEVLAHYPRCIAAHAGDLVKGVPRETRFLPTPADVIAWCERESADLRGIVERDDRERHIIGEMKRTEEEAAKLEADRKTRPTLKQMQEKYGPNWGLKTDEAATAAKAAHMAALEHANRSTFQRECEAAGIDPAGGVSPSLTKLMNEQRPAREAAE